MTPLSVGNYVEHVGSSSSQGPKGYIWSTGDQNPLHTLESGESCFDAPVVYGILLVGMVSALIDMQLPGPGSVYASQELCFIRPVFCGDIVTVACRVTQVHPESGQVRLWVQIRNQKQELVLFGYVVILPS